MQMLPYPEMKLWHSFKSYFFNIRISSVEKSLRKRRQRKGILKREKPRRIRKQEMREGFFEVILRARVGGCCRRRLGVGIVKYRME